MQSLGSQLPLSLSPSDLLPFHHLKQANQGTTAMAYLQLNSWVDLTGEVDFSLWPFFRDGSAHFCNLRLGFGKIISKRGFQLSVCSWGCWWAAGMTCSAVAFPAPQSSFSPPKHISLLTRSYSCAFFEGREVERKSGRLNVLPFILCLCLACFARVCGTLPPEMCSTWYSAGWVFRLLHTMVIEALTMPTFEMQRETVVSEHYGRLQICNTR